MTEEYSLGQRSVAEFIGTFSIIFFGAGAVVIDFMTVPEVMQGRRFVLDGLGHGALGWVGIALAHLAAVGIPIYIFGKVSGAHINPAVTAAMWVMDRIEDVPAAAYVVAQLAGGVAGGLLFVAVRGRAAVEVGGMGATAPFPGVSPLQAVLTEAVITFFLMLSIMALAVDDRGPDWMAGLGIGLTIALGILATGNITGASFNPARTLGPYVTNTVYGGPSLWQYAWIYVVGPTVGAIAGGYTYAYVALTPRRTADPETAAATSD